MDLTAWAFYVSISAAVLAGAALHYRRREPAGRGRYILAGLRGGALCLLLLLLFDPVVPDGRIRGGLPTVALVDASLSMGLPAPDGTTRWEEARRIVEEIGPSAILLFGAADAVRVGSLADADPDRTSSRLGPALRSVLEAGPARVVVVTDGALEDAAEAVRLAADARVPLEVRIVGQATAANLGLVELAAPRWAGAGEEVEVLVGVARVGAAPPDSVTVVLSWGDVELARTRLAVPPEGRTEARSLRFVPSPGMEGTVRLDARIEESDAAAADNVRTAYVAVAEEPGGVVLVSFRADQEPRFLLPLLERSLGLPTRGWLAVGSDRFVRLGVGPEAGGTSGGEEVRTAVGGADLVVLHGIGPDTPGWALSTARLAARALLFPTGPLDGIPVVPGSPGGGDWYIVPEIASSPAGTFFAGVPVDAAPPLTAVRPTPLPVGWWAPLHARRDRRGPAEPVLAAGHLGERRLAVALAEGYWRWAFDERYGRPLYDALWAGVGSWLVTGSESGAEAALRPDPRAVPRGEPVRWVVPQGADSLRVRLEPVQGPVTGVDPHAQSAQAQETVVVAEAGTAVHSAPGPGHYRFTAWAYEADDEPVGVEGEITVESYSPELTRPARELTLVADDTASQVIAATATSRTGRPLRTAVWPYGLVILLVCAEWVLRRRWGLR
jgi:hypothetical protein